ncbi:hypothetical protein VOLCADRAFT_94089 [Volvox carteri f. nagariensis]|uniref:Uncharacterized protein n=1 Tax=Volvox carteri f. nagariensis TaxID=3068 RepID=D8U3W1_VOLCA|nr:uncharacterized protein VOLCADRAFT_94089 [Volvox carteri f. nagariensis]EFJ45599.1 hypothetical protein VOLCADRAFT_94089 [Volvox carteri f. nagariensis]|eukprot:XP_002953289.1 hypothetical protein VOLCADRAFT_94089 [Volvox carteri f. nagariensis]
MGPGRSGFVVREHEHLLTEASLCGMEAWGLVPEPVTHKICAAHIAAPMYDCAAVGLGAVILPTAASVTAALETVVSVLERGPYLAEAASATNSGFGNGSGVGDGGVRGGDLGDGSLGDGGFAWRCTVAPTWQAWRRKRRVQ